MIAVIIFGTIVSHYFSPCMTLADIPPNDANHYNNPVTMELSRRLDELVTRVTLLENVCTSDISTMANTMELENDDTEGQFEILESANIAKILPKMIKTANAFTDLGNEVKESVTSTDEMTGNPIPDLKTTTVAIDDNNVTDTIPLVEEVVKYPTRLGGSPIIDGAKNTRVGSATSGVIAFHARTSSNLFDVAEGHMVVFDHVITNVGGNYDSNNGIFTCSQAGVYVFSWTIQDDYSHWINTVLVRNGRIMGYGVTGDTTYGTTGSATVAIALSVLDKVWIKVYSRLGGADILDSYTTFTGFRIQ